MEMLPFCASWQGAVRQITAGLSALDAELFDAIAESPVPPLLDKWMPALSRAADHAKLWFVIAGAMAIWAKPSARRAAGRGVATLAVTSLVTNQVAKRVWRRKRPSYESVPLLRRLHKYPEVQFAAVWSRRQRCRLRSQASGWNARC